MNANKSFLEPLRLHPRIAQHLPPKVPRMSQLNNENTAHVADEQSADLLEQQRAHCKLRLLSLLGYAQHPQCPMGCRWPQDTEMALSQESVSSGLLGPVTTAVVSLSIVELVSRVRRMRLPNEPFTSRCPWCSWGALGTQAQPGLNFQPLLQAAMNIILKGERGLCLDCVLSETDTSCQGAIMTHKRNFADSSKTWDELVRIQPC